MIIYKITNQINNKIYIGLTTCSLEYRWVRHIIESKNINNTKHLYKAMRKYGIENFTIEVIDKTNDFKKLGELERYYIRKFNSTNPKIGYNLTQGGESNQYDGNPSAKVTVDDVIQIRKIYAMGELSLSECWKMYSDNEVIMIRKYYVNHTLQETYDKYGEKSNSKVGFRQVLDKTYSYLPFYKKNKKQWILNGKVIDINNYKPVSTISEAGE